MNILNIRSVDDSLRLGQLKGNHFDIVIRNLKNQINDSTNLRERILEAIENVKVRKLHFIFMYLFNFQCCTHGMWKFPGQGLNWSNSCWPTPQPQQCGILSPLSEARDQTSNLMVTSRIVSAVLQWELPRSSTLKQSIIG